MAAVKQNLLLLVANLLIPLGVSIFFVGFFRGRLVTSKTHGLEMSEIRVAAPDSAPFDKVVFMMIDALRSDFVYAEDSGFTFTQSLIRAGAAIPFTALAASPTLTLSRIKALTQGTSQSFLDAFLNVLHSADARRLKDEDTWLSRLKEERDVEKKMVFYGVDMWTMLYPDIWDRYETVDSFYLPDFTAVDHNITKHLPNELENDDWKALVLHYVGLDNVAHFGGSRGSYMLSKQEEMDSIVRQIYETMEQKVYLRNTLLVLLGDHGMTEKGNHGGDSTSEIASALVFMSPRFKSISKGLESPVAPINNYGYHSVINQIDIVPTFAGLLGVSIPASSAGRFIAQLLSLWQDPNDKLQIMLKNAKQIMGAFETKYNVSALETVSCTSHCEGCPSQEAQVVCLWEAVERAEEDREVSQKTNSEALSQAIDDFSKYAQQCLSVPINNLSFLHLFAGIICIVTSMPLLAKGYNLSKAPWDSGSNVFVLITALHAITMFRSRFVEEEHLYWYWTSLGWLGYIGLKRIATGERWSKSACPIVLQFLGQCLNPSGDVPYSTVKYIDDFMFEYPIILWVLGSSSWVSAANDASEYLGMSSLVSLVISYALGFSTVIYKICSTQAYNPELVNFMPAWLEGIMLNLDRNYWLRVFWTGLVACIVYLLVLSCFLHRVSRKVIMAGIVELVSFYIRSQARPKDVVLFSIFALQVKWLLSPGVDLSPSEIAVTTLLLSQSSFYAGGRSNSFASFDMMNGYNGIDHTNNNFNALAVTLQTILSNWLGPVWWSLASLRMLLAWLDNQHGQIARCGKSKTVPGGTASNRVVINKHSEVVSGGETKINSVDVSHDSLSISITNRDSASSKEHQSKRLVQHRRPFFEALTFQTTFTATSTLAVMLACKWLRNDPVLWTVLAPRYVNAALWAVFHHFMINVVLCTGMWSAIVR